jgi:hypothetical protein
MISATGNFATLAGGHSNRIQGAGSSVIGGGWANLIEGSGNILGGHYNSIYGNGSIVGGWDNTIEPAAGIGVGRGGFIGGGWLNTISSNALHAIVNGGEGNTNNGWWSSIGGGLNNRIGAEAGLAVIPGGNLNVADRPLTFAAGYRAKAMHQGTFVWADSTQADFASTGNNQFLIRASGGVGIGTTSPQEKLDVDGGDIRVRGPDGFNAANEEARLLLGDGNHYIKGIYAGGVRIGTYPVGDAVYITEAGNGRVGIGRLPTTYKLEVEGDASKSSAGNWQANSDRRIKTDISSITNALERLDRVRLVSFRYTPEYRAQHPSIEDRPYMNVVAQEFATVFPNSVKPSGDKLPDGNAILSVDTYPLTIYSAAAVQELHAKLRAQNAELKHELASQLELKETEIAKLRTELQQLKQLVTTLAKKGIAP